MILSTIFWLSVAIVVYTYLGYPIVIAVIAGFKKRKNYVYQNEDELPSVTLVIPAYNEEDFIEAKIENSLALEYPKDKFTILFVADGSSDNTLELIENHPVKLLYRPERAGKIGAINRALAHVKSDIVIFNDANTILATNTIHELVKPFSNTGVGAVSGEKKILVREKDSANSQGEGLYWKYESFLKRKDAEVHSVMGAAGELIAFRTELLEEVENDVILDDFVMTFKTLLKGFKVEYAPNAVAMETSSATTEDEMIRKIRIAAGGWQAMSRLTELLKFWKRPLISFMYISHRVLRWSVSALLLPVLFILNGLLLDQGTTYRVFFALQALFYSLGFAGYLTRNHQNQPKLLFIPFYFLFMNYAVWAGFFRFLNNGQSAVWVRAERAV